MPKAILEFDLPEEDEDFKLAIKAGDYWDFLADISRIINRDSLSKRSKAELKVLIMDILYVIEEANLYS